MNRLIVFNSVSLDGYFTGANGDLSWLYSRKPDTEWDEFVAGNASGEGRLVFGRVTYEMMASYWPTPMALQDNPAVAERMNAMPKLVFSRKLDNVTWSNTELVKGDLVAEIRKRKQEPGIDMAILGSGTIVSQLAQESLIDEFQVVVTPIVLGKGRTMFDGVNHPLNFKLTKSRTFRNGSVVLYYEPAE
ncbi:MAG: dihydrofolate reductase family protein [Bryobacteraceae bacterium]